MGMTVKTQVGLTSSYGEKNSQWGEKRKETEWWKRGKDMEDKVWTERNEERGKQAKIDEMMRKMKQIQEGEDEESNNDLRRMLKLLWFPLIVTVRQSDK